MKSAGKRVLWTRNSKVGMPVMMADNRNTDTAGDFAKKEVIGEAL